MRICWGFMLKMFRYTSRLNIALVIICLGAVLFTWNRCQVAQLESRPALLVDDPSTRQIKGEKYDRDKAKLGYDDAGLENNENDEDGTKDERDSEHITGKELSYKNIEVLVNGETKIQGHLENKEVYIPFSFIRDYFEIEGKIVRDDFKKQFHVRHTSYEYFTPNTHTYEPNGSFLWFVNYNVEGRSRVKCITGVDEVPISTQWGDQGYRYPIQIAQYGLSHFSMWVEGAKAAVKVVDDCENTGNQEWSVSGQGEVKNVYSEERKSRVMEFNTNGSPEDSVTLNIESSSKTYVLSFDILFKSSGSISIALEVDDTKAYTLLYDTSETLVEVHKQHSTATYGIGPTREWRRITRNLWIDLNKAIGEKGRKRDTKKRTKLRITEIRSAALKGEGLIDNITLREHGHRDAFMAAAKWLLKNQDQKGGWPIPVRRKIKTGVELDPGWYSAMAQGQAISVLTRAYHVTKKPRFLAAAKRAIGLFHVESKKHGILATFMNKYRWYEEYPMTPPLFVLNGFLYSLMGLYDLKMTLPLDQRADVERLFQDGMTSLRAMILMYDSGSGTIYDLRHLTMGVEPNLARWDYHATHVNQLTWVTMINSDQFYKKVLERWKGYFKGIRAKHN
ncbi:D-glucuronyl C5-epimerase B-like [Dendronephthya gigantea]|uniref:D-glucuronyl C5-epimerase B-like n=1 Tax=Dendronephthya gigantea TaxID=151771 RepID=UPI00106B0876|nr:D-glucuronyl C5-epimerase B-like [Dendronephthya gigantea]